MSVRGIDYDEIHAGFTERSDAIHGVRRRSNGGAYAKPAAVVLRGAREFRRFLEVFHRDHADQLVITVYYEHFFNTVLVKEGEHLFLRRVLAHRNEPLFRCHDRGHRRIELLFEAQIAMCDDADRLASDDHGDARDAARARDVQDLADRHVGRDRDRVLDDAALELLYATDLEGLRLDGHTFVDDADTAFLRKGDREARFGDSVHCR